MATRSDTDLEFNILRTLCRETMANEVRMHLLPKLTDLHFDSVVTQNIYRRIKSLIASDQVIPAWSYLIRDPGIRKDARMAMRNSGAKSFKTRDSMLQGFKLLEQYRKIRGLYNLGINLEEGLDAESLNIESILEKLSVDLQSVRDASKETPVINIGVEGNATETIKRLLTKGGPRRIPTGFHTYDDVNRGIPRGALWMLGGPTGGGKSTLASVIAENMAMNGARTCLIPLEMNHEEVLQRDLARISGTPLTEIIDIDNMVLKKKKRIYRAFKEHQRKLEARGGKYSIIDPRFDATMENVLEFVKPLEYDVVIIDYVGLLSGVGGDDQWRQLSNVTAYAKRWAELNGCVVVILVQVSDDGHVRYAQAMKEHASYAWIWGQPDRINNWIVVKQLKARMSKPFDIPLYMDFDRMIVRDLTKQEMQHFRDYQGTSANDNKQDNWKKKRKVRDAEDSDDDDEDIKPRSRDRKEKRSSGGGRFEY